MPAWTPEQPDRHPNSDHGEGHHGNARRSQLPAEPDPPTGEQHDRHGIIGPLDLRLDLHVEVAAARRVAKAQRRPAILNTALQAAPTVVDGVLGKGLHKPLSTADPETGSFSLVWACWGPRDCGLAVATGVRSGEVLRRLCSGVRCPVRVWQATG